MPWTSLDGGGNPIGGLYNRQQDPTQVFLTDTDPKIIAYLALVSRKSRTMFAISANIFALTGTLPTPTAGTQKANIILDLFTGNIATGSQKWQQDAGLNAAALAAVYASLTASNGLTTFNAAQQLIMAAMYTQDNPGYLVNPSFDPTINIAGDQPA